MLPAQNKEPKYLNLGHLAPLDRLWLDSDGDGYPDDLRVKLRPAPNLRQGPIWAALCNLVARLAVQVICPALPLAGSSEGSSVTCIEVRPPAKKNPHAARLEPRGTHGWCLSGHSAKAMARILESLALADLHPAENGSEAIILERAGDENCWWTGRGAAAPCPISLCDVKGRTGMDAERPPSMGDPSGDLMEFNKAILKASAGDPRVSRLSLGLELPERMPAKLGLALLKLVARAAAEATEITLPLAWVGYRAFSGYLLKVDPGTGVAELKMLPDQRVLAVGSGVGLAKLITQAARIWFDAQGAGNETISAWLDRLDTAADIAQGTGNRGRLAHGLANHRQGLLPELFSRQRSHLVKACNALGIHPPPKKSLSKGISRRFSWTDEVRRLLDLADSAPAGSGVVECLAFVSKPVAERLSLSRGLEKCLSTKGYTPRIKVFNAYKPGLDWLLNEIAPRLPAKTARVRLTLRPFEGQGPDQLEMKSRWLQEIYPAPDLLARQKGWSMDQVQMQMRPGQSEAYRVVALDGAGGAVLEAELTPPTSCFPYLTEMPQGSSVHPTCIGLKLSRAGHLLWEQSLPSDREVFWRRFQKRWLPEMERQMLERRPAMRSAGKHVFWQEVRIEVAISETEEALGIGQERVSPMEALHEDLYFGLIEFMGAFNHKHSPDEHLQMGRIVPVVHSRCDGKPWARLRLRPLKQDLVSAGQRSVVDRLQWFRGRLGVHLNAGEADLSSGAHRRISQVARAWGFDLTPRGEGGFLYQRRPARPMRLDPPASPLPPLDPKKIPLADQTEQHIRALEGYECLHVWSAGSTLQKRSILAVEANAPGRVALGKARFLKPTLLVNARHHANEVSGTNAALGLARELGATRRGREMLQKVNVVIIPQENADGVATFEELLPHAPGHKLHAARYNAMGVEWYAHYHDDRTPFPEARVKTRLFRRWLPAYLLDLHGVPSHEWEQPFAGYLNPRFREHWIPRTFVYAILPFFGIPEHPGAQEAARLADDLSVAMAQQPDIGRLNQEIQARYHRYGPAFEPDQFESDPVESDLVESDLVESDQVESGQVESGQAQSGRGRSLVVLPATDRIAGINFAHRYWPLVRSEVMTEVLDEVARGDWLEGCGRAHQVIAWTLLEGMARQRPASLIRHRSSRGVGFAWAHS